MVSFELLPADDNLQELLQEEELEVIKQCLVHIDG